MEETNSGGGISFFGRLGMAFRVLFNASLAAQYEAGKRALEQKQSAPPEVVNAPALLLLSGLQREGRLIDFVQQNVTGFSDEEIGAAARVVHGGCRKALDQLFSIDPASKENEGAPITVPRDFDPKRIRLTGNVAGQPPFKGTLKHHGWVVTEIRLPQVSDAVDPRVLAPAEVELA